MSCRLFSTQDSASQIIYAQAIETPIGCGREEFHHFHEVTTPRFGQFVEAASFTPAPLEYDPESANH